MKMFVGHSYPDHNPLYRLIRDAGRIRRAGHMVRPTMAHEDRLVDGVVAIHLYLIPHINKLTITLFDGISSGKYRTCYPGDAACGSP